MYATITLIIINCIVFVFSNFFYDNDKFSMFFALNNLSFHGFYWQCFTNMFLHANLMHLAMNMVTLFQLGSILEKFLKTSKFLFFYIVGGILTSIISLIYVYYQAKNGVFVNIVGASGALCVLIGILAILDKNSAKGLILSILIISFVPLLAGINIAWFAHLIGFGIGACFGKAYLKLYYKR